MVYTHGALLHGNSLVGSTAVLLSHTFGSDKTGKYVGQLLRSPGTAGNVIACVNSYIHHWPTPLQPLLATRHIVHKGAGLGKPRLVALEEKSNAVECHAGFLVCPGVVGEYMEEETVHAQGEVAVEECLEAGRSLVPHAAHLRKTFGLHVALAVDMGTTDGIEHVVGLVMGGRVKPVLTHRQIGLSVVLHAVGNHRRGDTLAAELHAILLCLASNGLDKDIL